MRVAVTGTPGTGKTTATERLSIEMPVVHANEVVADEALHSGRDPARGSLVVDVDALAKTLPANCVVESHVAHHLSADRVVVLRCHPEKLRRRLTDRGESEETVQENVAAEALDVILTEAVERHGRDAIYEIDTTEMTPAAVAEAISEVVSGRREPSVGVVDFSADIQTGGIDPS